MKSLFTMTLTSAAILLSSNVFAAKGLSENQAITQCKSLASTQLEDVKKVRVAKIKNTRGQFKAKLRVISENDKSMYLCTISNDQEAQLTRLDKKGKAIAGKS